MDADLGRTKAMFAKMVSDGLDVSAPLRWGYFSFHEAPEPLGELSQEMEQFGYSCESLHETDDGGVRLAEIVTRTVGRGGKVVVPAFALGRVRPCA